MGITLPNGFSPWQAVQQVADDANPFDGGSRDRDVFSEKYNQQGSVQGATTNGAYDGALYYDNNAGKIQEYRNGQWGDPQSAPDANPNPTNSVFNSATNAANQAAAEKAQEDANLRAGYNTSQNNYNTGARTQFRDIGDEYDVNVRNFLNSMGDQQGEINQGSAQNQLNLRQSMSNIIKGIQTGVRSGGVALAGVNASDSGASEALARAYAQSGNQQTGEARGSAADQFAELQRSQGVLDRTKDEGFADQDVWKTTETNRVKTQLSGELQALAAEAQGKGINGVIDTESVNGIVQNALARLQQIDQGNAKRKAGIRADTADQSIGKAVQMEQAGATGNAFNVTGPNVSYGGQGGAGLKGASASQMPLYVKDKDSLSVVPGTGNKEKEKQLARG